jgi:hypothetical protein
MSGSTCTVCLKCEVISRSISWMCTNVAACLGVYAWNVTQCHGIRVWVMGLFSISTVLYITFNAMVRSVRNIAFEKYRVWEKWHYICPEALNSMPTACWGVRDRWRYNKENENGVAVSRSVSMMTLCQLVCEWWRYVKRYENGDVMSMGMRMMILCRGVRECWRYVKEYGIREWWHNVKEY